MTSDSRASAAPHVREPSGFWEWLGAVDDLVLDDGTKATALSWTRHCVYWPASACRLREPGVGAIELARRRRRDRITVGRHLKRLVRLGLLVRVQEHAPGQPQLYLAAVPADYVPVGSTLPLPGFPSRQVSPATPEQVSSTQPVERGQVSPATRNRLHGRNVTGVVGDTYTFPTDSSDLLQSAGSPPLRVAGATLGNDQEEEHDQDEDQEEDSTSEVLAQLRRAAPAVLEQVDTATRLRLTTRLRALLALGWQPDELVRELTRATLDGTRRPVGALVSRVDALAEAGEDGLRQLHAEQAERQARRAQQGRVVEDEGERSQRVEAERWAEQLAGAMAGDELNELLDLIVAEHHPELAGRGPASMRRGVARAWLLDEYRAGGDDGRDLAPFLAEVRAKLDRALDAEAPR